MPHQCDQGRPWQDSFSGQIDYIEGILWERKKKNSQRTVWPRVNHLISALPFPCSWRGGDTNTSPRRASMTHWTQWFPHPIPLGSPLNPNHDTERSHYFLRRRSHPGGRHHGNVPVGSSLCTTVCFHLSVCLDYRLLWNNSIPRYLPEVSLARVASMGATDRWNYKLKN